MKSTINRREFITKSGLAVAAVAGVGRLRASASPSADNIDDPGSGLDDLDFASAAQAAEAIRRKRVSSVELVRRVFDRIDRYNPRLNAFVYQLRDEAMAQARQADEARAQGRSLGALHGVPVHVKECFAVAGRPCTWGIEALRNSKAPRNSEAVDRLVGAGAVLIGATNVPVNLSDWQSYNPIYGTTNNPWDVTRTPGGSSGGSAAALAAGLGYLSVGSDIGGSIRVPSHFCGVYGHKPTLDLVSTAGMQPGGGRGAPGFSTLLAVAGPLARSAGDLLTALKILGGPVGWDAKAWKWRMPAPRASELRDFRVGYVLDEPFAPPTAEVKTVLESALRSLERAGAKLKPGWPKGFAPADLLSNYIFHLFAFQLSVAPADQQEALRKTYEEMQGPPARAAVASFTEWQNQNFRRLGFRALWQEYFEQVDVFLTPVSFSTAFPHDHSEPQASRKIATSTGPRSYFDTLNWIAAPTLTGCPATAAPIGKTAAGLPVGIQIMGPYWEDATPITFAELLSREFGGFTPPPGYSS